MEIAGTPEKSCPSRDAVQWQAYACMADSVSPSPHTHSSAQELSSVLCSGTAHCLPYTYLYLFVWCHWRECHKGAVPPPQKIFDDLILK